MDILADHEEFQPPVLIQNELETMCGFIRRVTDNPAVLALLLDLGITDFIPDPGHFYPGSQVDIVRGHHNRGVLTKAVWWFLIDRQTGKPNYQYTTFNARRLDGRMWHKPLQTSRCIIPVDAFGESQGTGKDKQSWLLESDSAFLLGGLYQVTETQTGPVTSFAVITRDPHPKLEPFHAKSCPLFLPADKDIIEHWLHADTAESPLIQDLLAHPRIPTDFHITPVKSTKRLEPTGEVIHLQKDT